MQNISPRFVLVSAFFLLSAMGCKLLTGELATPEAPAAEPPEAPAGVPFIVDVVTSTDIEETTYEPVGITDSFTTSQSMFHCVVITEDAPENTAFKAVWSVLKVEGVESGYVIGEYELTAGGSKNIDFAFQPYSGSLPPGEYQVQIFVNGLPDRMVQFTVLP